MLLIEVPVGTKSVFVWGDSIAYGAGDGFSGSGSLGDTSGDALGNLGYIDQGINEVAGLIGVNVAHSGDANKYTADPTNTPFRRQMMALANPTHIINENGTNDMTNATTPPLWAQSTSYAKYTVVITSANSIYICLQAGTSSASGTGPSGTGLSIADGTCMWGFLLQSAVSNAKKSMVAYGNLINFNAQLAAAQPSAKLIGVPVIPQSSSTDNWATTANQSVGGGGATGNERFYWNPKIQALDSLAGLAACIQPNQYLEYTWPTVTAEWVVNGTAFYVTPDGVHPNSVGDTLASPAVTASSFP